MKTDAMSIRSGCRHKACQCARALLARMVPDDLRLFVKVLCARPQTVGAPCPSSRRLANYMAAQAIANAKGTVVELGAGTGVVTQALLDRGLAAEKLIVVEQSPILAGHLRARFPQVTVLEGDAARLRDLLGTHAQRVSTIVSSLPLRSLPRVTVDRIGRELDRVLPRGATFIQFTYSLRCNEINWTPNATCVRSRTIWRNLPPARVNTFAWGVN